MGSIPAERSVHGIDTRGEIGSRDRYPERSVHGIDTRRDRFMGSIPAERSVHGIDTRGEIGSRDRYPRRDRFVGSIPDDDDYVEDHRFNYFCSMAYRFITL